MKGKPSDSGLTQLEVGGDGNRLVAFVPPGCRYCRIARQKLAPIARRGCLPDGAIVYMEPGGAGDSVSNRADGTCRFRPASSWFSPVATAPTSSCSKTGSPH